MSGPWPHPDSGILYFRKDIPADLKRAKHRLVELKVPYKASIHRSLETKDRKLAEVRYRKALEDAEALWAHWRVILEGGPITLSHKDLHALAGEDAKLFLKEKEDDPQELRKWTGTVSVAVDDALARCGPGPSRQRQAVFELGQFMFGLNRFDLRPELERHQQKPDLIPEVRKLVETVLAYEAAVCESWGAMRARNIAYHKALRLDQPSMARLQAICTQRLKDVMLTLRSRMAGDYREPEWAKGVPTFSGTGKTPLGPLKTQGLTFKQVIDREERRGADKADLMAKNRATSKATIKKYRQVSEEFAAWRKSEDITSITIAEVNAWMQSLFATGKLKRTTVRLKAQALQALCGWAQEQGARESKVVFPNGLPLQGLPLPEREETDSADRTFSIAQAQTILKATRGETDPERRWVPWLLAYTGMRVGDSALLSPEHFMSLGEQYFILVQFEKTKSPRWIPLHSDVVREGFIDFLKAHKGKTLFSPRVQANIWEWVNFTVFSGKGKIPPANHGWRHFMESIIRRFDVSIRAGLYLTGRAMDKDAEELLKSTARGYGNDELALMFYASEMEKIQPILDLPQEVERVVFRPVVGVEADA